MSGSKRLARTGRPCSRISLAGIVLFGWLALPCASNGATTNHYQLEVELLDRLIAQQWFDYAQIQLDKLTGQFPDKQHQLIIRKARILFFTGKRAEAGELLSKVPKDSDQYYDAVRVKATFAQRSGEAKKALELYGAYFGNVQAPGRGSGRSEREKYGQALQMFASLLMQENDPRAAAVMKRLQQFRGQGGTQDDRTTRYLQAKIKLDGQSDAETVDRKAIDEVLEEMGELKYGDDMIAALSYVQRVRAHILLEDYEKALTLVESTKSYLADFDKALRQRNQAQDSPLAGLFYHWARALKGKAIQAHKKGDDVKAQEYLLAALKRSRAVSVRYPDAKEYPAKATVEYEKIKQVLQNVGLSVSEKKTRSDALLKSKLDAGDELFQNEEYGEAAETFLEGLRSAPLSDAAPPVALRLAICYAMEEDFLRAQAIALYMNDLFPDNPETADAFLNVGSVLYNSRKSAADLVVKQRRMEGAVRMWERFLAINPSHPKGQDLAFIIAEHAYGEASEAAAKSKEIDAPENKKEQQKKAFALYREAIPKYEFLIENYGSLKRGIRALYKLGWIYYTLEEYETAIGYFAQYSAKETQPRYGSDVVEAKFRAGEILLQQLEKPMEALSNFEELLQWISEPKEGVDPESDAVRQRKVDGLSYTAWCYDFKAESFRGKLNKFNDRIDDREDQIEDFEEQIRGWRARIADAATRTQQAQEQFGEIAQSLPGKAVAQEDEPGSDTEEPKPPAGNVDEEILRKQQELDEQEEQERAEREAQNRWSLLAGEKIDFEKRIEEAKKDRGTAQIELKESRAELEEATERKTNLEKEIADLEKTLRAKSWTIKTAKKNRQVLQDRVAEVEDELTDVKERAEARERKVREQAQREKAKIEKQLATLRKQLQAALDQEREQASDDDIAERNQMEKRLASLSDELSQTREDVQRLSRKTQRLEARIDVDDAAVAAFTQALKVNAERRRLFKTVDETERKQIQATVQDLIPEALASMRAWTNSITKRQVQIQGWAKNDMAGAQKQIEALRMEIADLQQQQQPIRDKLREWKRKAAEHFEAFLAEYPENPNHAPSNMSRLGGIYLEFNKFDKAVAWLEKLRRQFPDAKAGKQAMFDLGRALQENGQTEEAARVFGQAMDSPKAQSLGNLTYISRTMLEAGAPNLALDAAEEILRRSQDQDHENYQELQGGRRETALFRAAEAALAAREFEKTRKYVSSLLQANEQTAFYFDALFARAEACVKQTPPRYDAALKDLGDISLYAKEPFIANKAAYRLGRVHEIRNQGTDLRKAVTFYQQIVELGDPEIEGMRTLIEKAIYHSCVVFTKLENADGQRRMKEKYRNLYPGGQFMDEIRALPRIADASAAAASAE